MDFIGIAIGIVVGAVTAIILMRIMGSKKNGKGDTELVNANAVINDLKQLDDDMARFARENITNGDFEYRIDESKYSGAFRNIVANANSISQSNETDLRIILDKLQGDADGVPDQVIPVFQGKKKLITEVLQNSEDTLMAIFGAVLDISENASKGHFDSFIDTSKFKGEWVGMFEALNNILVNVNTPLQVISMAVEEMSAGRFDLNELDAKITRAGLNADASAYQGEFNVTLVRTEDMMVSISSYVSELEDVFYKMANGDLRNRIDRAYAGQFDNIRISANNITTTLSKTMTEISTAATQVLSGANQISTSAAGLASGTQEQASSVEELNTTINRINQQTQQNAENARTANELSGKSNANAQQGNNAMKQMVEAMSQIKESSNNISQIVRTIQDIAFQTNLLALNASVEAARAGDHGKGFSVVADEVRNLAGRSQQAATETTTLIQDSISRVESGAGIAETTAESLDAIVASANEVLSIIKNISAASKEQAEAVASVSDGIAQISRVVQDNSAVSEETAAASEELNSQAELLRSLVAFFKL